MEKTTLDALTQDSVSIKKQKYIEQNGQHYNVGQPWRRLYENSVYGREQVENEIEEPYRSVILLMWGRFSNGE